jgi:hypothetical protein
MKKGLIPVLFVLSGAFSSGLWSTVQFPCRVSRVQIAVTLASPLLQCAGEQLFTAGFGDMALRYTARPFRENAPSQLIFASIAFQAQTAERQFFRAISRAL